jgi:hypothetical protein
LASTTLANFVAQNGNAISLNIGSTTVSGIGAFGNLYTTGSSTLGSTTATNITLSGNLAANILNAITSTIVTLWGTTGNIGTVNSGTINSTDINATGTTQLTTIYASTTNSSTTNSINGNFTTLSSTGSTSLASTTLNGNTIAGSLTATNTLSVYGTGTASTSSGFQVYNSVGSSTFVVRNDGTFVIGNSSTVGTSTINGDLVVSGIVSLGPVSFTDLVLNNATSGRFYATSSFDTSSITGGYFIDNSLILQSSSTLNNIYLGKNAGNSSGTTGLMLTAIGEEALQNNTSGNYNSALGYQALKANTSGNYNDAFGEGSQVANTSGSYNSGFGEESLYSNISGSNNVAVGVNTLFFNTNSVQNVALGTFAGEGTGFYSNTGNTLVGYYAGHDLGTGGDYNTVLGFQAGTDLTTGMKNIILGTQILPGTGLTSGSNNILIGDSLQAGLSNTGSNQLNIGNLLFGSGLSSGSTVSTGTISIGTTTSSATLTVGGSLYVSGTSTLASTTVTNLLGSTASISSLITNNFVTNNATLTNATITNILAGSISLTEINAQSATITNATTTNLTSATVTSTNLAVSGSTTLASTTVTNILGNIAVFVTTLINSLTANIGNIATLNSGTGNFTNVNATGTTQLTTLLASTTNASTSNASTSNISVANIVGENVTNSTITNATITNLSAGGIVLTNVNATNATLTNSTSTNLVVSATTTSTGLSAIFANITSAIIGTIWGTTGNFATLNASTTNASTSNFVNAVGTNATLTNATTTNLVTTNLKVSTGVATSTNVLTLTNTLGTMNMFIGTGDPNSNLTSATGSLMSDITNGALYIKTAGTGNTNWQKVLTASGTTAYTTGSILFANSSGNITQDNNVLFYDSTNNRIGFGTNTPGAFAGLNTVRLEFADDTGNNSDVLQRVAGNGWGAYQFAASQGTKVAPTIISNTGNFGEIDFSGYDGAAYQLGATIRSSVDGTPTAGSMPGLISFRTTPSGSVTPVERMRISANGIINMIGTTTMSTSSVNSLTVSSTTLTSLFGTNATITNATITNLSANITLTAVNVTSGTVTNSTSTNIFSTNASITNATSTNFFTALFNSLSSVITTLTAYTANIGTINATSSVNALVLNASTTNATTSNFINGSTTYATLTNATSTNFFATNIITTNASFTTATTTNLFTSGATTFGAQTISDLATGGNIGSAATTVDIDTVFNINQTTSNQTVTLPSPTNTTAGKIIYVNNIGTAEFTLNGSRVRTNSGRQFVWNGSAWSGMGDASGQNSIFITKSANQALTASSITLQNVTDLTFPIAANEVWVFSLQYNYTTGASATPDIRWGVNNSGTGALCDYNVVDSSNTAAAGGVTSLSVCNSATGVIVASAATGQKGGVLSGTVSATGAGTIQFRAAQGVSNAAVTTILASSTLQAFRIRGADLAEVYYSKDDSITLGDVVAIDGSGPSQIVKTGREYDAKAIGVVSTKPGLVIGDNDGTGKPVIVGLSGRVPVKVSTINGAIHAGDYLTSSFLPGIAMKATDAGQVIGQALTDYNATSTDEIGSVVLFIKNSYYDGYDQNSVSTTTATSTTLENGNIADRFTHLVRVAFEKLTDVFMDMTLWVRGVKTDKVETKELCLEDVCVTKDQLKQMLNTTNTQTPVPVNNTAENTLLPESATTTVDSSTSTDMTTTPITVENSDTIPTEENTPPTEIIPITNTTEN